MSDIKRCEKCNGSKFMVCPGLIEKKCDKCSGVGWLTNEEPELKTNIPTIITKKRGRPKLSEIRA